MTEKKVTVRKHKLVRDYTKQKLVVLSVLVLLLLLVSAFA